MRQAALIRINTEELRNKLEDLGFEYSGFDRLENPCIATSMKRAHFTTDVLPGSYSCISLESATSTDPRRTWGPPYRIDCGEDIELFLKYCTGEKIWEEC